MLQPKPNALTHINITPTSTERVSHSHMYTQRLQKVSCTHLSWLTLKRCMWVYLSLPRRDPHTYMFTTSHYWNSKTHSIDMYCMCSSKTIPTHSDCPSSSTVSIIFNQTHFTQDWQMKSAVGVAQLSTLYPLWSQHIKELVPIQRVIAALVCFTTQQKTERVWECSQMVLPSTITLIDV